MESMMQLPFIWQGTLAGILIGLMILLGAIHLLMFKEIDQKKQDLLLGMSGGFQTKS
jgi:cell division protein FtsX